MASSEHFERKSATAHSILVIALVIIFPFGFACTGKFNSVYSSFLVSWSNKMARFSVTLLNYFSM